MPPRLLIVDDDRTARTMLAKLLARDGFETIVCGDGLEALQLIETERPALVVSDYEMPGFTGAQLCVRVRRSPNPEIANLPLILLTAHAGEQHELESLAAGANDFVTKPVNPAVLKARIATQLRLNALRQQLEVQNAELEEWHHRRDLDLEAAQLTQRAILPVRLPAIEGWEVAAHYQPVIQVGGDMYDWIRLPDRSWLFWVADATGHGASAALLTALTKLVFRHAASESSHPGEIMGAVNAEFHSTLRGKSFMTAACVAIAPKSGQVIFSGAGHPPLLVVRESGATEELRSSSPPLGILAAQEFGAEAVELRLGDIAMLYTDGLYASRVDSGDHFGPDDLRKVLPRPPDSAEEFVRSVVTAAYQRQGAEELEDDLAVIALLRKG